MPQSTDIRVVTESNALLASKAPKASPTFTGTVSGVTKAHVGLGNVDNTSDLAKPISTLAQAAINDRALAAHTHTLASGTGLITLAQLPAGSVFQIQWDTAGAGGWVYNGAVITTRPSSRTSIHMQAVGGSAAPTFAIANDQWMPEVV